MALHYVLDGYNIIKQTPSLSKSSLEASRESLLQFIDNQRPQGSPRNKVTIVFDGQSGIGGYQQASSAKVIFSSNESADEIIKRMVAEDARSKTVVVVTNDREIQYYVRAHGAKVMAVQEFLTQSRTHQDKNLGTIDDKKRLDDKKQHVSRTQENSINKELEEIWLKNKPKEKE